ncbi:MAG: S49 family peptidase [Gammaproteobacteria bacterium]|nr:S49 family peptidase [Gammaproteobacteria bacterium]
MSDQDRSPDWERKTLEELAFASLKESRRQRRWGIFFKLLGFAYLFLLLGMLLSGQDGLSDTVGKHTALVDLKGVIADDTRASADNVVTGLRKAFEDKNTVGVILRINSPGGSPVQSSYINAEIKRLRKEYPDIPLYAVITDIGASGAYYVAAAADKIYADEGSIVGSIGVRMDGFGFVDAIDKLGIDRRLYTAGDRKGMLDPFLPEDPSETAHIQVLLDQIHQQFIDTVRDGRGDRLKEDEAIFSGLVWTGEEALKLGLIDEFGSAGYVAREVLKEDNIEDFTKEEDLLSRLSDRLGSSVAQALILGIQGDAYQVQ